MKSKTPKIVLNPHFELENAVRETCAVLELLGARAIKSYEDEGDFMEDVATGTQYLVQSTQAKLTEAFDKSWEQHTRELRALKKSNN